MLIPYSLNLRLNGIPFFSTLIGAACFFVFVLQLYSEQKYIEDIKTYCKYDLTEETRTIFSNLGSAGHNSCAVFFIELNNSDDTDKLLNFFAFKNQLSEEVQDSISREYDRFLNITTKSFTEKYWHDPQNPKVLSYFTSSIMHADIEHIVMNLIFFFAFAIAVEQTLGSIFFILLCGACCVSTGLAYEQGLLGAAGGVLPTIGLSGVVSGVMSFCLVVYPLKKISIFYWFFFLFGFIKIPLMIVVSFYILSDLYGLKYLLGEENVNYVAHLSGSITGVVFAFAFLCLRQIRRWV